MIILHRLLGSLGFSGSNCKLLQAGRVPDRKVLRLAFSSDQAVSRAAWDLLNARPQIISREYLRDASGVARLTPEAELVLRQPEAAEKTIAQVLRSLGSPSLPSAQIDYLLSLLKEHRMNKQGEVLSELGKIDPVLAKRLCAELLRNPG